MHDVVHQERWGMPFRGWIIFEDFSAVHLN